MTAGAFGTSIATTVWENRAAMHHAHLTEAINSGNLAARDALASLPGSGSDGTLGLALLNRLINTQAYVLSADDVFYGSAVIFLLLVPLVWLARRQKVGAPDSGGAH